jgi:hypothetical protein
MDKKRSLNREKITSATINRLLAHYNAFNVFELIQFAQNDGVRLPAETNAMTRKAIQHFIDKYNQEIKDAKRRVKVAVANEKRRITNESKKVNKQVVIDVKRERFNNFITQHIAVGGVIVNDNMEEFNRQWELFNDAMILKCKKLKGIPHAYVQFTVQKPFYDYSYLIEPDENGDIDEEDEKLYRFIVHFQTNGFNELIDIKEKKNGDIWMKDIMKHFTYDGYAGGNNIMNYVNFRLVVMISDDVPSERITQSFRDGEKHCVIMPLYELWKEYGDKAESVASKKRCYQIANKILKFEEIYPDGVPEDNMEEVAKVANRCIILKNTVSNESMRWNSKSTKYFHFTNTRKNHVEKKLYNYG